MTREWSQLVKLIEADGLVIGYAFCRVNKKGCARQNASRVVAVRPDQSCAREARRLLFVVMVQKGIPAKRSARE